MIDFISTNPNIETQAKRSAHLLAAVISRAMLDLMERPTKEEVRKKRNNNTDALQSLRFFFGDENDTFKLYSRLIGVDPEPFLKQLTSLSYYDASKTKFTVLQLRSLRVRIAWYRRRPHLTVLKESMDNEMPNVSSPN